MGPKGDRGDKGDVGVKGEFPGQFLLIWLHFSAVRRRRRARWRQVCRRLFGLPELHAGTPKTSQNILLKWPLPHRYFARKKPLNFCALLTLRKCCKFRTIVSVS